MDMEQFDYLTYKKNKQQGRQPVRLRRDKRVISTICIGTFLVIFLLVMGFIASKSSKIDIEYGRLGENTVVQTEEETVSEEVEENEPREKYTIDKRLFLIHQEEKGPSEAKIVNPESKEQTEVISKIEFEQMKSNSRQIVQKAEKQTALKQPVIPLRNFDPPVNPVKQTTGNQQNTTSQSIIIPESKANIKPKLPVKPAVQTLGAIERPTSQAKVLVGKYQTAEEARRIQNSVARSFTGLVPYVKKVNNYYSVQIGTYESFDVAKTVAAKLKIKGYDVWILQ